MRKKLFDSPVNTIIITGLLAGTLDAVTALLVYQVNPMSMFRFIASGAFGPKALAGGLSMALCGALFHYVIAFSWTIIFFVLYPRISRIAPNKYLNGVAYGVVIWLVMNLMVLPMTRVGQAPLTLKAAIIGAVILIFAVGLPVSLFTHRHYARKSGS
mgnify:CR=1 FL=1